MTMRVLLFIVLVAMPILGFLVGFRIGYECGKYKR